MAEQQQIEPNCSLRAKGIYNSGREKADAHTVSLLLSLSLFSPSLCDPCLSVSLVYLSPPLSCLLDAHTVSLLLCPPLSLSPCLPLAVIICHMLSLLAGFARVLLSTLSVPPLCVSPSRCDNVLLLIYHVCVCVCNMLPLLVPFADLLLGQRSGAAVYYHSTCVLSSLLLNSSHRHTSRNSLLSIPPRLDSFISILTSVALTGTGTHCVLAVSSLPLPRRLGITSVPSRRLKRAAAHALCCAIPILQTLPSQRATNRCET